MAISRDLRSFNHPATLLTMIRFCGPSGSPVRCQRPPRQFVENSPRSRSRFVRRIWGRSMRTKIFLIVCVALLQPWIAQAQFKGEITGAGGQKFPIAVSPLKNIGGNTSEAARLSTGIADAMVHDLELSGWFRVLDRSAYIENAQSSGISLGTFDFKDWATIGAEGLVKGGFSVQGEDITVELRLFDVYQNKERIG